ncbi:MAG: cyclic nucleotide-binding domain-containing protein [Rhodothermales bacterium]|nr:cyclic nucleotide-binding domain-containing protein [Rhodothermales bacterium]
MVTVQQLKKIPMFSALPDSELAGISGCFTEERIAAGENCFLEGDPANSACFVICGDLEVLKALPGGGAARINRLEPGTMIGEMALVAGGVRTATVRATRPSIVLSVQRDFFNAALDQVSVPAFKILRSVAQDLAARLDDLQVRILNQWGCEDPAVPVHAAGAGSASPVAGRGRPPSFDFRKFLPTLPFFESFTGSEIDRLVGVARVVELPRGEYLFREGEPAGACYVIVRGAIETSVTRDRRYQLSVLGPGRVCGTSSLLTHRERLNAARLRSAATLLELDQSAFDNLYLGDAPECLKFQKVVSENLLVDRRIADNLLSTLVNQDAILDGVKQHGL